MAEFIFPTVALFFLLWAMFKFLYGEWEIHDLYDGEYEVLRYKNKQGLFHILVSNRFGEKIWAYSKKMPTKKFRVADACVIPETGQAF